MRGRVLIIVFWFALLPFGCGYNEIQGLDEGVKAAWAEVQNQYQRRADLVPNLVRVVSAYASHERETLTEVTEARARAVQIAPGTDLPARPEEFRKFQSAQAQLSGALNRLMVVVEKYPELKANDNFRDLQSQLEGTENRIAVARNRYIRAVEEYNKKVRYFPTNLTAKYLLGLSARENFTAPDRDVERVPDVKF